MELKIDGMSVTAKPGQSLLDLVRQLELDQCCLSERPIAARIAGEVFNLNYIPVRLQNAGFERQSIRTAMAASGGVVQLLRYSDPSGKDVYSRTVQFLLFLALHRLWPHAKAKMNCTVGASVYMKVCGIDNKDVIAATKNDKKMEAGVIKFILIDQIGHAYIDKTVSEEEMELALSMIMD